MPLLTEAARGSLREAIALYEPGHRWLDRIDRYSGDEYLLNSSEMLGFWRKLAIEEHYKRLKRALPGRFVLVVSEQYRADEADEFATGDGVYRFKRTPIAAAFLIRSHPAHTLIPRSFLSFFLL